MILRRALACAAMLAVACHAGADNLAVTINGTAYTVTFDGDALGLLLQRRFDRVYVEKSAVPASYAMPDGTVWTVDPDGGVWVDARKLGTVHVSMLTLTGKTVYGKGLTDGKWYRWTGAAWADASDAYVLLLEKP